VHHPVAGIGAQVGDLGTGELVDPQRGVVSNRITAAVRSRADPVSASAAAISARAWSRSNPTVAV
jgi:hypothetical protein